MSIRSRFQGVLVGALIGDCLGAYWEMKPWAGTHPLNEVEEQIVEQVRQTKSGKAPAISYTDDTAMTLAMARSLVDCKGFNPADMAKKFTEEFFSNPQRGYGASVFTVFNKLKKSNYEDLFMPGQEQFNGEGSFGNGAAMRTSPAALLGYHDNTKLVEVARDGARLTHAHISGVYGAILQSLAIKLALQQTPGTLRAVEFVDSLLEQISPFEDENSEEEESKDTEKSTSTSPPAKVTTTTSSSSPDPTKVPLQYLRGRISYTTRLEQIKALLLQPDTPSTDRVARLLGHSVLADEAVSCALYAFMYCSGKSFRELIPYAISLGGDADTIASMAGAIGGAYWGMEGIPAEWVETCEEAATAKTLADSIYDLVFPQDNN